MAVTAITGAQIAAGSLLLSSNMDTADFSVTADTPEVTVFASGGFKQYTLGLKDLNVSLDGFNDYAVGAYDEWERANAWTEQIYTVAPLGGTVQNVAAFTKALVKDQVAINAKVGDPSRVAMTVMGRATPLVQGQVTQPTTSTVTVTGNSTSVNVGAVSSTQTIYAAIHVISVTGTTPSLTCQLASSTTSGGAFTVRGSAGSALTTASSQWLSAAGPFTDTWWRLNFTVSGTLPVFTVLASIGIV
jgi:hypothetical protein